MDQNLTWAWSDMKLVKKIDSTFYKEYQDKWDDKFFRQEILNYLTDESIILDLGAGSGRVTEMNFKKYAKKVCGVDLDERVTQNPFLDEGLVSNASEIPYPDNTFDVVFSDNVLEHLEQPLIVFNEVFRVLKPNGVYLFKTPNKWHYMPVISRTTPHKFHEFVNKLRGRDEDDTFPTIYKANSKNDIAVLAKNSGLQLNFLKLIEGRPEYLRMFWFTYVFGLSYERIVNSFEIFDRFRILMIGCLMKPKKY